MADEIQPQVMDDPENRPESGLLNPPEPASELASEEVSQSNLSIFERRFALFMTQFGQTCESEGVELALAIVVDPKLEGKKLLYYHGGVYDLAVLAKEILGQFKDLVAESLG